MLHTYEAEIYVNNIRTKESVSASDTTSAKNGGFNVLYVI